MVKLKYFLQDEKFYEGEDPYFELEEIPDYIVSTPTAETYTLAANEYVFWKISGVKFQDNAFTSDSDDADTDDRDYLDITLETVSKDDETFSEDEWENAEVLTFDASEVKYACEAVNLSDFYPTRIEKHYRRCS